MTLWTVSNQGFTVHNHTCGINFLSHLRGAPQKPTPIWDRVGYMGGGRGRSPESPLSRVIYTKDTRSTPLSQTQRRSGQAAERKGTP